ncbi:MAG: DegT/DnrJ/EryC1/StrS family aminotransferase [Chthoniobacterales bacterium]|nr:DegT/DnrJ/EryC1/StrS family aminotransferase [Chthoniobacterales bacterium]
MTTTLEKRSLPYLALGGVWEQDDVDAAQRVIAAAAQSNGNFFPLPEEADFQKALAAHEGAAHAVAVNSCGTALDLCMIALGVGPGDEVIVPGLTFVCSAGTAAARGAKVVFADVDPATLCLDPKAVRAKITPRTKAIIPVHFAGHSADIRAFDAISQEHGIPVIYDAAHAVGTKFEAQPIGGAGLASCYSFQSNKNITTLGEGGAITSNNAEFAEKVRGLKTFGYVYGAKLRVTQIGYNYRMTKPQAATGLTQLAKIDRIIARRLANYQRLVGALQGVPSLTLPVGITPDHGCHLFVIRIDTDALETTRDAFAKHLKEEWQVGTAIHYPAVWSWEAFAAVDYDKGNTPVTEQACEQVLSMPLFPSTTDEEVDYLAHALRETVRALQK